MCVTCVFVSCVCVRASMWCDFWPPGSLILLVFFPIPHWITQTHTHMPLNISAPHDTTLLMGCCSSAPSSSRSLIWSIISTAIRSNKGILKTKTNRCPQLCHIQTEIVFSSTWWCVLGKPDLTVRSRADPSHKCYCAGQTLALLRSLCFEVKIWLLRSAVSLATDKRWCQTWPSDGDGVVLKVGPNSMATAFWVWADLRPIHPFCVCRRLLVCGLNPRRQSSLLDFLGSCQSFECATWLASLSCLVWVPGGL